MKRITVHKGSDVHKEEQFIRVDEKNVHKGSDERGTIHKGSDEKRNSSWGF